MKFFKDFKAFALKGNVLDLAVGVIIGGAFGKIVTSLVNDIIMPVITGITGKISFENLFVVLNPDGNAYLTLKEAEDAGVSLLKYGSFITNVVDFLIIALCIFIIVSQINKLKPKEEPAPVTTKECPFCKTKIHIDAVKCPNCTSDIEVEAKTSY